MSTLTDRATAASPVAEAGEVELTYRQAIGAALDDEMEADPSVLLMGEDVGAAGGVFKTNEGLIEKYGPQRIINTPISENGFVGVALGMAVSGLRPVVEIMFSDFLPSAGDAVVNELPKFRFMSGGQTSVPVTVRSIGGGTGRFGTQHSATGESWYIGLPGLRVVTAGSPGSAYELLRAAIRHNNPVLFFEHKGLYGRKGPVRRGAVAAFGRAEVIRHGADVTIAATLLMVERSLAAASVLAEKGVEAEVIDMRWLSPLDVDTVRRSVESTGRLVVAEEQVHAGGWGATLISRLVRDGARFASPPRAVSLPDDVLIPYSPALEDAVIPTAERIAEAALAVAGR
jgi:acetoin:2,6-dichlorophenolindophenol oxidoreductase subunit beta